LSKCKCNPDAEKIKPMKPVIEKEYTAKLSFHTTFTNGYCMVGH